MPSPTAHCSHGSAGCWVFRVGPDQVSGGRVDEVGHQPRAGEGARLVHEAVDAGALTLGQHHQPGGRRSARAHVAQTLDDPGGLGGRQRRRDLDLDAEMQGAEEGHRNPARCLARDLGAEDRHPVVILAEPVVGATRHQRVVLAGRQPQGPVTTQPVHQRVSLPQLEETADTTGGQRQDLPSILELGRGRGQHRGHGDRGGTGQEASERAHMGPGRPHTGRRCTLLLISWGPAGPAGVRCTIHS